MGKNTESNKKRSYGSFSLIYHSDIICYQGINNHEYIEIWILQKYQ